MTGLTLTATALLLFAAGYAYLVLLGTAAGLVSLPRRWLPLAPLVAPLLGWAVLVALGYPLNTVLPFRLVAAILGAGAAVVVVIAAGRRRLAVRWRWWREAGPPLLLGLGTYLVAAAVHARQGALTALVVDSDVEHFADVIAALLHYPIGMDVVGQQGLEATPVGLAYHYVHAALSAVTGRDAFGTALPAHFLMLALSISGVYVFARSFVGLVPGVAFLATVPYAFGALPLAVAAFGWGQQTAALATVPIALAALRLGVTARDGRSLWAGGLLGALASGSLYLATAPLVGGAAGAMAVAVAARGRTIRPLGRLLGIGGIVLGAGLLSHLSAGAFLLERVAAGLLRPDELSGRSTHVFGFAGPDGLAGVAPLDLYREVTALDGAALLSWPAGAAAVAVVATLGAIVLVLAGTLGRRRAWPALPAVLGIVLLYGGYLRWVRPFPYGEFKLLSTVWFLVPVLAVAGWTVLSGRAGRRPLGTVALAAYLLGVGLTWAHTLRFLSLPWGAVLPEAAMADARLVAGAVPRGASVYVSGQLTPATLGAAGQAQQAPPAAQTPAGQAAPNVAPPAGAPGSSFGSWTLTSHRAGFNSVPARAGYLAKRWRGAVTSLLAFSEHPLYGLVQRHSTELRAPVAPALADYLVLDAAEDPRLFGAVPEDLVLSAGTLRLYRQERRPTLRLGDLPTAPNGGAGGTSGGGGTMRLLASADSLVLEGDRPAAGAARAALAAPVLPIGESLPGRRQGRYHVGGPVAQPRRPPPGDAGHVLLGFHAIEVSHVRVTLRRPDGAVWVRDLVLAPGLTWYTTPESPWPATVDVALPAGEGRSEASLPATDQARRETVRPVGAMLLPPGGRGELLERSAAGTAWPLLTLATGVSETDGALNLEAWYTYLGPREGSAQARLRDGTELWTGGQSTPVSLHLGPGGRSWRMELRPGTRLRQEASDGREAPEAPPWDRGDGRRWLWLEIGPERGAALHEPPLLEIDLAKGGTRVLTGGPAGVVLPLLAEPAPAPAVAEGTLVKGSADDLYYVDGGKLRWVPATEVLERYRIPWRLSVLEDHALWRLPVGLPLS